MPMTRSMRPGPMPEPVEAPPAVADDEVTVTTASATVPPAGRYSFWKTSATIEVMAPEWLWGLAVMFIGGFGLWALSRERRMLNIAALVLLGAFYGSITAFILLTTPAVSGVPVYGGLALLTLFCAYRA